jgi:glycosyltransferase involved in cell wall biosynthesis
MIETSEVSKKKKIGNLGGLMRDEDRGMRAPVNPRSKIINLKSKIAKGSGTGRFAVVIPVYNHAAAAGSVIDSARSLGLPVIVVDDGSTDGTPDVLRDRSGIRVIRHPRNRGKGAALLTGFQAARETADWAVTIDADGQHRPEEASALMEAADPVTRPIVVGCRREMTADAAVPWTSRFGRGFSNFWVWVSGGPRLSDSQSGFRVYPLPETLNLGVVARRYQYEVEVLVRARRRGIPVVEVPVSVTYRPETGRISHFRPFVDFGRNTAVFARLITGRIFGIDGRRRS